MSTSELFKSNAADGSAPVGAAASGGSAASGGGAASSGAASSGAASSGAASGSEPSGYVPQTSGGGRFPPRRLLLGMMVAVFFSGGVIGSGSTLMLVHRRIEANEKKHHDASHHDPVVASQRVVSELTEKLSLSEKQTAQVKQITIDHLDSLDRLRREVFFKMIRDDFKQMEDQVNAVLDEEQRAKYHAWLEEKRQRLWAPGARHGRSSHRTSGGPRGGSFSGKKADSGKERPAAATPRAAN